MYHISLVWFATEVLTYGMANHGIFRDFFLTQRAKLGDNPAQLSLGCAAQFSEVLVLCNFQQSVYVFMYVNLQREV